MKRRLRVCAECASHMPVATPLNAPCPFCGAVAAATQSSELRDVVLASGKSGVLIAALGLSMSCGVVEGDNENPNITADYGGGPINIEVNNTTFNQEPNGQTVDAGADAAADSGTDAGAETDAAQDDAGAQADGGDAG